MNVSFDDDPKPGDWYMHGDPPSLLAGAWGYAQWIPTPDDSYVIVECGDSMLILWKEFPAEVLRVLAGGIKCWVYPEEEVVSSEQYVEVIRRILARVRKSLKDS